MEREKAEKLDQEFPALLKPDASQKVGEYIHYTVIFGVPTVYQYLVYPTYRRPVNWIIIKNCNASSIPKFYTNIFLGIE